MVSDRRNADSKIQITFEDGNTLIGYIECVEYGTYSDENDILGLEKLCIQQLIKGQ